MTANPFESSLQPANLATTRKPSVAWRIGGTLLVIIGILFLIALFLPVTRGGGRPVALRVGCINNARQIGLALLNYEMAKGHFPPAYSVDSDGNRLHSWRTLILPYIEEQALYDSIDLTKPWDDPANAHARETYVSPYVCPSSSEGDFHTHYLALVGPNHVLRDSKGRKFEEIKESLDEGSRHIAMIMEAPVGKAVHWMEPRDADAEFLNRLKKDEVEFNHDGVFIVGFMDNRTLGFTREGLELIRREKPIVTGGEQDSM